jgi:hypothetical protein
MRRRGGRSGREVVTSPDGGLAIMKPKRVSKMETNLPITGPTHAGKGISGPGEGEGRNEAAHPHLRCHGMSNHKPPDPARGGKYTVCNWERRYRWYRANVITFIAMVTNMALILRAPGTRFFC